MPVKVKICGINAAEAADAALRAGADFGGLVFYPGSPRHLGLESAAALAERMRERIKIVALVVDAADEVLGQITQRLKPDFFQLHGSESPSRAADIKSRFGIAVIKAFALRQPADLDAAMAYDDIAEMFLFDAPVPAGADRPGGHGAAFDWQMLAGRRIARPWLLAGGLKPDNVARAIAVSGAAMVDVSSGVESAPGVKSESLILDFVAAARQPSFDGKMRA